MEYVTEREKMKSCLVIVDMQNAFINENTAHLPRRIAEFIKSHDCFSFIAATRYCNTRDTACYRLGNWKECMSGTSDAEIVPEISPYVQRTFDKTTYSGFTAEFREFVKNERFDRLFFCGVNTDCCVLATVLSCYDSVQDCAVIADLCASTLGSAKHEHALDLLRDNITKERVLDSRDIPPKE